jgi:hypothetical protein
MVTVLPEADADTPPLPFKLLARAVARPEVVLTES